MSIEFRAEAGLAHIFAVAVGDEYPYADQLFCASGEEIVAPPTFTRAVVEHFDREGELRSVGQSEEIPDGGSADRLHAEQHFEYVRPLRAGERITAHTRPGRTWRKPGRSGTLEFTEVHTDFLDDRGEPIVLTRRVGVQVLPSAP